MGAPRQVPTYHGFFCASCKRGSPDARTIEKAKSRSVLAGWLIESDRCLCPECRRHEAEEPVAQRGAA